jgi:hypothetical protein
MEFVLIEHARDALPHVLARLPKRRAQAAPGGTGKGAAGKGAARKKQ